MRIKMTEDIKFKLITYVDTDFETKTQKCEYFVELEDGVERPLKDILKENIEQKRHIKQLMIQNTLLKDKLGLIETKVVRMGDDDG